MSILRLVVAFLLGAGLMYLVKPAPQHAPSSEPDSHSPVKTTRENPKGDVAFTAGGWIEAPFPFPVAVSALAPGRIDELLVWEGQKIEKGGLIARLYDRDFKNEVKLAEAKVGAAESHLAKLRAGYLPQEVEKARAETKEAAAKAETAKRIFLRSQELFKSGAVSQERLDTDEGDHLTASAKQAAAEQYLKLLEAGTRKEDVALAEAALDQAEAELEIAKTQLDYASICAPVSGVVLHRYVGVGDRVSPEKAIVAIYDPQLLQMRVDVTQGDIAQVFVGQRVEVITEAASERRYNGEVLRIEPLANEAKNTITVRIKMLEPDALLFPEMTARARFLKDSR